MYCSRSLLPPIFTPLWPVGRHHVAYAELERACVYAFPSSATRRTICTGLRLLLDQLEGEGVDGEMWVDGSFTTDKIDPNDVDLVLRVAAAFYDSATPLQQAVIDLVETDLKASHFCDSYVLKAWPEGHAQYWYGETLYAYWMRQWAFDREDISKGMPVLTLGGGFVV